MLSCKILPFVSYLLAQFTLAVLKLNVCVCLVSFHHRHWHWLNLFLWRVLHQLSIIPLGTWLVIKSLLDLFLRLIAQTLGVKERPLILFSGCSVGCALSPLQCIHIFHSCGYENWTRSYSAFSLISKCSLSSVSPFLFFLSILFIASLAWA